MGYDRAATVTRVARVAKRQTQSYVKRDGRGIRARIPGGCRVETYHASVSTNQSRRERYSWRPTLPWCGHAQHQAQRAGIGTARRVAFGGQAMDLYCDEHERKLEWRPWEHDDGPGSWPGLYRCPECEEEVRAAAEDDDDAEEGA